MCDFATFLEDVAGLTDYARRLYLLIDRQAVCVGRRLSAVHRPTALRGRAGPPWVVAECRELADALKVDDRLAAIKSLRAWAARPNGIGNTWINWYVTLLKAHVQERAASRKEAQTHKLLTPIEGK
jgi:hypothetical protein